MIEHADTTDTAGSPETYSGPSLVECCPRCCTPGSACDVLYGDTTRPDEVSGCSETDPCSWRATDPARPIHDHDELVMVFDRLVVAVTGLERAMGVPPPVWFHRILRPTDPRYVHEGVVRVGGEIRTRLMVLASVARTRLHQVAPDRIGLLERFRRSWPFRVPPGGREA